MNRKAEAAIRDIRNLKATKSEWCRGAVKKKTGGAVKKLKNGGADLFPDDDWELPEKASTDPWNSEVTGDARGTLDNLRASASAAKKEVDEGWRPVPAQYLNAPKAQRVALAPGWKQEESEENPKNPFRYLTALGIEPRDLLDDSRMGEGVAALRLSEKNLREMLASGQKDYTPLMAMGAQLMQGGNPNSPLSNMLNAIGASVGKAAPMFQAGTKQDQATKLALAREELAGQRAILSDLSREQQGRRQMASTVIAATMRGDAPARRAAGTLEDGSRIMNVSGSLVRISPSGETETLIEKDKAPTAAQLAGIGKHVDKMMSEEFGPRTEQNAQAWDAERARKFGSLVPGHRAPSPTREGQSGGEGIPISTGEKPAAEPVAAEPLKPRSRVEEAADLSAAKASGSKFGTDWAKDIGEAQDAAKVAQKNMLDYAVFDGALDKIGDTDIVQGYKTLALQIGNVFGVTNPEKLSATELFAAIQSKLQRSGYTPGEGAISDYERRLFSQMFPTLTTSVAGNKAILSHLKFMARYEIARADNLSQIQKDHPHKAPTDINRQMAKFAADFLEKERPAMPANLPDKLKAQMELARRAAIRETQKLVGKDA